MDGPTVGEIDRAFARAARILRRLKEVGVLSPWVKLYGDGSGEFHLGPTAPMINKEVSLDRVFEIIGSQRVVGPPRNMKPAEDYIIEFCTVLFGKEAA